MANCKACGGILGLDCFNEQDCLSISYNNSQDDYYNLMEAERKIDILIDKLNKHNITIPDLLPPPINHNYLDEFY